MLHIIAAERIRELRVDRSFKQREIAMLLHCTQVAYSNYEIGKRQLPLDHLIRLADFYKVSTDYILGMTDEKYRYPESKYRRKKFLTPG